MAIGISNLRRYAGPIMTVIIAATVGAEAQRPSQRPAAEPEPVLTVRSIQGVGPRARVPTPQYRTSVPQGRTPAGDWGLIAVSYDTTPDWIDELNFQYYALLLLEPRGEAPVYTLLRGAVSYIDIPRGRNKESTVFLRPNTLLRYGLVIAVAVEITQAGETVAVESQELPRSIAEGRPEWWRTPNLAPRDGHILNRAQTPFIYVNFDEFETIKP